MTDKKAKIERIVGMLREGDPRADKGHHEKMAKGLEPMTNSSLGLLEGILRDRLYHRDKA